MKIEYGKAMAGGLVGTVLMTIVGLAVAPMMGIPKMDAAAMHAGAMGGSLALGWMAHFMIGTVLALIYGRPALRA